MRDEISSRPATVAYVANLVRLRRMMFEAVGFDHPAQLDAADAAAGPRYRRRGIARRVMCTMLSWLAEQGVQHVTLHATDVGRPLYAELGFEDSNEMRLAAE